MDVVEKIKENERRFLSFTEDTARFIYRDLPDDELEHIINYIKKGEHQSLGRQKLLSDVWFSLSPKDFSIYKNMMFNTYQEYLDYYED